MAFEYDGEQHFKFPTWFHKSQEAFEKLQADDAKKTLLCEQHGIKLYRVPYWVKFGALPEFVSDAVGIAVSLPFDPGRKLGINMTSCYTGASLAKKTIFAKHYKQLKYPIYTLAPSIDKFIRDFYRGGRVDIFTWVACLVIGSTTSTSPACIPGLEPSLCLMANLCGSKRLTQKPFTVSFQSKSKVARVWLVRSLCTA